jgi:NADPH:quinone reductase
MRRVRYHEYGGPEVLAVEEAETPVPGPGQVLVEVSTIGTNFVDTRFRRGPESGPLFQRPLPGTLTGEVVGRVSAVGPGGDESWVGRRVAALSVDAYADFALAEVDRLVAVPPAVTDAVATVLPMSAPVALRVLRTGRLAPGEAVLVHSAAGSTGNLAVRIARLLGAGTIVATASSRTRLDFAAAAGAEVGVDYTRPDWPDQVRAAVPAGVDVVLDGVGGETLVRSLDVLAPGGRAVAYGAAGGDLASVPVSSLFALKSVAGFTFTTWQAACPDTARAEVDELAERAAAGHLTAAVHATLPLTEAAEAHRMVESRSALGRVLLTTAS